MRSISSYTWTETERMWAFCGRDRRRFQRELRSLTVSNGDKNIAVAMKNGLLWATRWSWSVGKFLQRRAVSLFWSRKVKHHEHGQQQQKTAGGHRHPWRRPRGFHQGLEFMQIKNIHKNKYCFISWIFRLDNMRELWRSLLNMVHVCVCVCV